MILFHFRYFRVERLDHGSRRQTFPGNGGVPVAEQHRQRGGEMRHGCPATGQQESADKVMPYPLATLVNNEFLQA